MRLAVLTSHPIQYYAPLFRELARRMDLHVLYAHRSCPADQARAGFNVAFQWDVDLLSGYSHSFLHNVARHPDTSRFSGCDTPQVGDELRRGRFDALLMLGWHLKCFVQALVAAKRIGLPVLVRGDSQLGTPRSPVKKATKEVVYPLALRLFDRALYVGARSRAYYEHYRYPPERLHFSPHCVDTEWFRSRATSEARRRIRAQVGIGDAEKVVLFAGKLVQFKRPIDVVEAMALPPARGTRTRLMIVGSGELGAALEARARELQVPMHMLGFQNQTAMPAVYAAADALILPSTTRETWGLVCNEALACGTPIIVSNSVGCAADLAADGEAGRVFPMGDTVALSHAVATLLDAPPACAAVARVSSRYSLTAAAQGVEEALASVRRPRGHTSSIAGRARA